MVRPFKRRSSHFFLNVNPQENPSETDCYSNSPLGTSFVTDFSALSLQSNNLVIHSVLRHFHKAHASEGDAAERHRLVEGATPHFVTCTVEHDSIRLPLEHLVEERVAGE